MSIGPTSTTTLYSIPDSDNVDHSLSAIPDSDNVDHSLSTTDCEKDLGVWISSTLCPNVQCQRSYAKTMQSLAIIKQTFKYIMKESFNILYKTYIRPHIEYCIQAWNPYYAKDIDLLEKIQHWATKLILQLANLPYKERIQNLNLYSLYCRRKRVNLIETFKILKQCLHIDPTKFFTLSSIKFTRGHDYKLYKPRSRLLTQVFY